VNKMKRFIFSLIFGIIAIFLNSCIPDESPVTPHQSGDVQIATAEMGNLYGNQVYFSFK